MGKSHNKKDSINQYDIYKGLRKTWEINPKTRVVPNTKKKSRKQSKQAFKKKLIEEGY